MSPHLEVHKKIRALLKVNVAMETIMQQNPWEIAFEGSDAKDFKKFCFSLCQLHRELGEHFNQEFFPDLPKMHHLMHCCLQCDVLSPKMTWGYKDKGCEGIAREMLCLTIETAAGGREGGGVGRVVAGYVRAFPEYWLR